MIRAIHDQTRSCSNTFAMYFPVDFFMCVFTWEITIFGRARRSEISDPLHSFMQSDYEKWVGVCAADGDLLVYFTSVINNVCNSIIYNVLCVAQKLQIHNRVSLRSALKPIQIRHDI